MKKIINKILFTLGVLLFIILAIDYYFPNETERFFNRIEHITSDAPSEDIIQLSLDEENRLYTINAEVNGCEMEFILDTGCSSMLISTVELLYLKRRGIITNEDYIGETTSTDADGDVTKCQVYNIDELTIGNYVVYDVQCAVSNQTTACMLLGQEVLQKFTSVTINYENHTLKLEK